MFRLEYGQEETLSDGAAKKWRYYLVLSAMAVELLLSRKGGRRENEND
jgi:hypothetical protein